MTVLTVESNANLEQLLEGAEQGDVFVIQRKGREVARLTVTAPAQETPAAHHARDDHFGWAKGILRLREDFDDPLPWDEWLSDEDETAHVSPNRTS